MTRPATALLLAIATAAAQLPLPPPSDVAGTITVKAIQGRPISPKAPVDKEMLTWSEQLQQWQPEPWLVPKYDPGHGILMVGATISVDSAIVPTYSHGAGPPVHECYPGRDFHVDTAAATLYYCRGLNQWEGSTRLVFTAATPTLQLGPGATAFYWPGNQASSSPTRSAREILMPTGCTMRNLFVRTSSTQYPSGSITITATRNGQLTPLSLTIAPGAPAALYRDATNTVPVEPGDAVVLTIRNSSPSQSSARIAQVSLLCN